MLPSGDLPFSQACENNKGPIYDVLSSVFADRRQVLEVGSGTGQHATFFAARMPHLLWQPTELAQNRTVLRPRCAAYEGSNLLPEQTLDVCAKPWPVAIPDALFTANTLHIMPWTSVEAFFARLATGRPEDFTMAVYGPFNYGGQYTSQSNARFDQWLHEQHPHSAIRDFEAVDALAEQAGLALLADNALPANNRLLVWKAV
ncbi:MAG: class I SAM-dependent methyltransferase [Gammaproteobacteria bacterium]|nr:class I SAM-dependent methyltransferase [Gammaproteobacteria bacterium]